MLFNRRTLLALVVAATPVMGGTAWGSELVYRPVNPGFGGFPSNFDYLFALANAQNQHQDSGGGSGAPIINFPDIDIDLGGGGATPTEGETPTTDTTTDTASTTDTTGTGSGAGGSVLRNGPILSGTTTFRVGNN